MRKIANEHNQIMPAGSLAVLLIVLLLPSTLSSDQEFTISNEDMIAIHADQGWEAIEPDTVHFSGHFEMRIRDLQLTADRATLYGQLDDPDRLELEGSPARISLSHAVGERTEAIFAQAQEIIYERESASMRLTGAASLAEGDNVLLSDNIEYDIKSNRFHTEGKAGVRIKVHPQK